MVTELQSAQSSRHRVEKSYELMGVGEGRSYIESRVSIFL